MTGVRVLAAVLAMGGLAAGCQPREEVKGERSASRSAAPDSLLLGTWMMTEEIVPGGKGTVWEGRPMVPALTFGADGTLVSADRLIDDTMKDRVPAPRELGRGSYELKDRVLRLRYMRDGVAASTTWTVRTLTASELVIVEDRSGRIRWLRRDPSSAAGGGAAGGG